MFERIIAAVRIAPTAIVGDTIWLVVSKIELTLWIKPACWKIVVIEGNAPSVTSDGRSMLS